MRPTPTILAALLPTAAAAHPGPHGAMERAQALWHALTQPDQLLALLLVVGIPVAGLGWALARRRGR